MKEIFRTIIKFLAKSNIFYKLSRKIIDFHDSLNNCELETNGEGSFINRNILNFDTIFDVGANVGEWSLLINRLKPEAKVFSFEPVASTYEILKKQQYNENVFPQNCALGETIGVVDFFLYGDDSTLNTAHNRSARMLAPGKIEKVNIDTVDNFCEKNKIKKLDFLKIDTEGYELSVLKGSAWMLKNKAINVVQFEYGGTYIDAKILLKDVFEFLMNFGYEIYKIYPKHVKKILKYSQTLENFQYSNYLAVVPGFKVN